MSSVVDRSRWQEAQHLEESQATTDEVRQWVEVRKDTWANFVAYLRRAGYLTNPRRVLDIGGKYTTVFLALREGERYAVDPVYLSMFEQHPFLQDVEELKGVHFLAMPAEEIQEVGSFDTIFCINMLDHMAVPQQLVDTIDALLTPGGNLILVIDCYADRLVREIVRRFDVDVPHPHHFLAEDIRRMFSRLSLRIDDRDILTLILSGRQYPGLRSSIPLYRIDLLMGRVRLLLRETGKGRGWIFPLKFVACYTIAFSVAVLRRKDKPIHPLKKARLFIFEKPHAADG